MKTTFLFALLGASFLTSFSSCEKETPKAICGTSNTPELIQADNRDAEVTCTGVIQEQGITTYQYGSHTIGCCGTGYALYSETINLDDYIGQNVTITGQLVDGYPVEDGPDYVKVTAVE